MKKNNCLFIFDSPAENHQAVLEKLDGFFSELCATHYVYVADPDRNEIDDSPGGARFLRWNEHALEAFGELATVVVADNEDLYLDLRKKLPKSVHVVSMRLSTENGDVSDIAEHFLAAFVRTPSAPVERAA